MKKIVLLSIITFIHIAVISCKTDKKIDLNKNESENLFSLEPLTTKIGWTAYKTNEKIAVEGQFTKINLTNIKKSATPREALNGIEFSIPISSLFTNNEDRDTKIKQLFFGIMDNTEILSGTINLTSNDHATITIKMNNITQSFPVSYFISGQMISITGIMNIENWKTQNALESLNKACFELHKGSDGISKTWSEVKIDVATYLKAH